MAMVDNSYCHLNPCAKTDVIDFLCRKHELPEWLGFAVLTGSPACPECTQKRTFEPIRTA